VVLITLVSITRLCLLSTVVWAFRKRYPAKLSGWLSRLLAGNCPGSELGMAQFLPVPAKGISAICTFICPEPEVAVEIRRFGWLFITIKLSGWTAKIVTSFLTILTVLGGAIYLSRHRNVYSFSSLRL
jgi:hypothetical protein